MAVISLASMLREAESMAYRIRTEAKGLSAVQAEIPKPDIPESKPVKLETKGTAGTGAQDYEKAKEEVAEDQEKIEKNKSEVMDLNPVTMENPNRGILLSEVLDLARSITGKSIFDLDRGGYKDGIYS